MLYHGIDLHKHSIVIGTFDDSGTELASKRLRTRRTDILSYLESMPGPGSGAVRPGRRMTHDDGHTTAVAHCDTEISPTGRLAAPADPRCDYPAPTA